MQQQRRSSIQVRQLVYRKRIISCDQYRKPTIRFQDYSADEKRPTTCSTHYALKTETAEPISITENPYQYRENSKSSIHFLESFTYGPHIIQGYIQKCERINIELKQEYPKFVEQIQTKKLEQLQLNNDYQTQFSNRMKVLQRKLKYDQVLHQQHQFDSYKEIVKLHKEKQKLEIEIRNASQYIDKLEKVLMGGAFYQQ